MTTEWYAVPKNMEAADIIYIFGDDIKVIISRIIMTVEVWVYGCTADKNRVPKATETSWEDV